MVILASPKEPVSHQRHSTLACNSGVVNTALLLTLVSRKLLLLCKGNACKCCDLVVMEVGLREPGSREACKVITEIRCKVNFFILVVENPRQFS